MVRIPCREPVLFYQFQILLNIPLPFNSLDFDFIRRGRVEETTPSLIRVRNIPTPRVRRFLVENYKAEHVRDLFVYDLNLVLNGSSFN